MRPAALPLLPLAVLPSGVQVHLTGPGERGPGASCSETTGIALLPIQRRDGGDFIGYCGLIIGRSTAEEPEIAYELFQHAHGRGYATEAAGAVLDAAVATGRKRLWATVGAWNTPSFRVLEKLGFERDHVSTEDSGEVVWLTRSLP